jgi:cellulase
MSKVADAATADGSSSFFKIFQDTWAKKSSGSSGSDDYWGTKDLNLACGKMDFRIPSDLAAGDYLLRAEAIALHAASGLGGAQFYMTCYQITVTGGGSSTPEGSALFPGAYKASDPGIQINIYQNLVTYIAPGPTVIAGGSEAVAGKAGSAVTATAGLPSQPTTSASKGTGPSTLVTSAKTTLPQPAPTSGNGNAGGCTVAKYQQCGGTGFSGCTTCKMTHARSLREICTDFELVGASGSTCHAQSGGYYSQCM